MTRDKVLVVGDLMLDRRIEGTMTRISPEAPVPIVRARDFYQAPGGAGNLAANLAALFDPSYSRGTPKVRVLGVCGGDQAATDLTRLITESGCALKMAHAPMGMTTVKTRITCAGQQILRIDGQEDELSSDSVLRTHLENALHDNTDVGAVVLVDYGRGALQPELSQWLMGTCAALTIPVFADVKPAQHTFSAYRHASLFRCNLQEAVAISTALGLCHPALLQGSDEDKAICAARALRTVGGFGTVVITMGAAGCLYHDVMNFGYIKTTPAPVYDVTGAGDTFMAALVTSLLQNYGLEEACKRANVAAGIAVSQRGTYIVSDDEWQDAIEAVRGWDAKIITLAGAQQRAERKRRQGKKVVLANGCFDLLHHGHLHMLAEAREQGDVLFVATNMDESIRALKGEGRPVIPGPERLRALAQFAAVDYVLFFDGDMEAVVRAIRPDVLVKGCEYEGTVVPGADWVAKHGGVLYFGGMVPGYSTTKIEQVEG